MFRRAILLTLATALAVAGSPARAQGPPVVTVIAAYFEYFPGGYRTPELELHVLQGAPLFLVNIDAIGGPHSITAVTAPGETPAFESDPIDPPRATQVRGVEALQPGAYLFTCVVHPDLMWGTLHVDP